MSSRPSDETLAGRGSIDYYQAPHIPAPSIAPLNKTSHTDLDMLAKELEILNDVNYASDYRGDREGSGHSDGGSGSDGEELKGNSMRDRERERERERERDHTDMRRTQSESLTKGGE